MATEIDVMNGALALLKVPLITAPTDNSTTAIQTRARYAIDRDAILQEHEWNFAEVQSPPLAQLSMPPPFGWAYRYQLPSDPYCLHVREPDMTYVGSPVFGTGSALRATQYAGWMPWKVVGRTLLANQRPLQISYTARITDMTIWSPLAVSALTYLLASNLAIPLTGKADLAQLHQKSYLYVMSEAVSRDSQEGSPVVLQLAPTAPAWR